MTDNRRKFDRDIKGRKFWGGVFSLLLLIVLPMAFALIITDYDKWSDKEKAKEEALERNRPKVIIVHEGTEYEVQLEATQ